MKSVMEHSFSVAPSVGAPRSQFNRSFGHKFVMDAGWLYPFFWDSVLPGDTFKGSTSVFARMSTPLFPIMENLYVDTHFFFIPNRIMWDNWKKFCGEQEDPGDSIDYQIPVLNPATTYDSEPEPDLTTTAGRAGALMNMLGVPAGVDPGDVDISALPFRAYDMCWNEWFRDQNLIDTAVVLKTDGPDSLGSTGEFGLLKRRGKRHDYFTSCLPWPQKGTAVNLPLSPITGKVDVSTDAAVGGQIGIYNTVAADVRRMNTGSTYLTTDASAPSPNDKAMFVDFNDGTLATINDLREAFQVQKLLERDARAGTRYSEIVSNHFGVNFYDVSYRPEYLGGGSSPIQINPVSSTDGANTGDQRAFGTFGFTDHGFTKSFVEHGIVMGFISIRADLTYQQGLNRHFSHSTRYDIYWPSLAHLGEQAVLNKEIFVSKVPATDDAVFGYQERYAEYRYKPSQISGAFQSAAVSSLDPWHLSQEFASLPTLSKSFIEEDPPVDRVIATPTEPHFIVDSYTSLICARPMPVFGVPGLIDHF